MIMYYSSKATPCCSLYDFYAVIWSCIFLTRNSSKPTQIMPCYFPLFLHLLRWLFVQSGDLLYGQETDSICRSSVLERSRLGPMFLFSCYVIPRKVYIRGHFLQRIALFFLFSSLRAFREAVIVSTTFHTIYWVDQWIFFTFEPANSFILSSVLGDLFTST